MSGVWFGVDVGTVRVGVARSDADGVVAMPLETLRRDPEHGADVTRVAELVREHRAAGVVVGLPLTLAGREGQAVMLARNWANALRDEIGSVPVEMVDERLSTAAAARRLAERGMKSRARRAVIDQAAAVEILQQWLHARA